MSSSSSPASSDSASPPTEDLLRFGIAQAERCLNRVSECVRSWVLTLWKETEGAPTIRLGIFATLMIFGSCAAMALPNIVFALLAGLAEMLVGVVRVMVEMVEGTVRISRHVADVRVAIGLFVLVAFLRLVMKSFEKKKKQQQQQRASANKQTKAPGKPPRAPRRPGGVSPNLTAASVPLADTNKAPVGLERDIATVEKRMAEISSFWPTGPAPTTGGLERDIAEAEKRVPHYEFMEGVHLLDDLVAVPAPGTDRPSTQLGRILFRLGPGYYGITENDLKPVPIEGEDGKFFVIPYASFNAIYRDTFGYEFDRILLTPSERNLVENLMRNGRPCPAE